MDKMVSSAYTRAMLSRPDPAPPSRAWRPVLVVLAIVASVAMGLGVCGVVRAAFEATPAMKPYDPLHHW